MQLMLSPKSLCLALAFAVTGGVSTVSQAASAYNVVYTFPSGVYPNSDLLFGPDGVIYGLAGNDPTNNSNCGLLYRLSKPDQNGVRTYSVIHTFQPDGYGGGCVPAGSLAINNGVVYGATFGYIAGKRPPHMQVFSLTPSGTLWTYKVLHSFGYLDGYNPNGVTVTADGTLYGTTASGGTAGDTGGGVLYKISPTGVFTRLHAFKESATDGDTPRGDLAFDASGTLYGTTLYGGFDANHNFGTVFAYSPTTGYQVSYLFRSQVNPEGRLVIGPGGRIFGTGGINTGILWSLTPVKGGKYYFSSVLGSLPPQYYFGLLRDTTGRLYGVAESQSNPATHSLFRVVIEKDGTSSYTALYTFPDFTSSGDTSLVGGLLYGVTGGLGVGARAMIYTYNTTP